MTRGVWLALLLALLVVGAHLPLLRGSFIQDDLVAVETNPIVARGSIVEIFSTAYWAGAESQDRSLYRPVTVLSFALERGLVGRAAAGPAHAVNIGLHLLATFALLRLLLRLGADRRVAAACSALFAVHPIHVEAVAGIVGRAELLAALFSFGALDLWMGTGSAAAGSERGPLLPGGPRIAAWGAAGLVFLALGAKEVALATPALMVIAEWLFRPRPRGPARAWIVDRLAAFAPVGAAVLLYAGLRIHATEGLLGLHRTHPFDNPLVALTGVERWASALALLPRYVRLLLCPLDLSADYAGPVLRTETSLLAPLPLVGLALLAILLALACAPCGRAHPRARLLSWASLLFLLPYLVVSNLPFVIGTNFAERLLYLPSAGFCLLPALLVGPGARLRRRIAAVALGALVLAFAVLSWARGLDWRDNETLFRAALRVHPNAARSLVIVGRITWQRGETAEGLALLDRAVAAAPSYAKAWAERGTLLAHTGHLDAAVVALRRAIEIAPFQATEHLNLGIAYSRLARAEAAERAIKRALLLDPLLDKGWATLGHLALARGQFDDAARAYRRAVALGREDLRPRLAEAEAGVRQAGSR